MSRHCIHMRIDRALSMSDSQLQDLFGGFAPDIRHELEGRQEQGELLIGSEGCEGFDPITGCPGHEDKGVTNA